MDILKTLVSKRSEDKESTTKDVAALGRFSTQVSKLRGEGPMATSEEPEVALEVISVNVKDIEIPANYPRKSVGNIDNLVASIRTYGIQQPLKVVKIKGSKKYKLVFGRRRLQAAEMAGFDAVPCIVELAAKEDRLQMLYLIENLQRLSLNPVEEASAYQDMVKQNVGMEELSKNLGIAQEIIQTMLEILGLSPEDRKKMGAREPLPLALVQVIANTFRKSKTNGKKLLMQIASGEITTVSQAEAFLSKS